MGKSTISMAIFNSYVTNYQRVHHILHIIYQSMMIPSSKSRDTTEALERTPPNSTSSTRQRRTPSWESAKALARLRITSVFGNVYEPGRWSWLPSSGYMVIIWLMIVNNNLVGGFCECFNHLEKYEIVNGKDDIPYMKWKMKFMFQTTKQPANVVH